MTPWTPATLDNDEKKRFQVQAAARALLYAEIVARQTAAKPKDREDCAVGAGSTWQGRRGCMSAKVIQLPARGTQRDNTPRRLRHGGSCIRWWKRVDQL